MLWMFGLTIIAVALLFFGRMAIEGGAISHRLAQVDHYELRRVEPDSGLAQLSETRFILLCEAVRRRRMIPYMLLFIVLALLGSVALMMVFGLMREYAYPGPWVWGLGLLFSLTAWCVACVAICLITHTKRKRTALERHFDRNPEHWHSLPEKT